jgi:hypothetical protein
MLLQTMERRSSDSRTVSSGSDVPERTSDPLKKAASQSEDFQFDDDAAPGELEDADELDGEHDDDFDEDDFDDDFDDDFEDWRDEDTDEYEELEGVPFSNDGKPGLPEVIKENLIDDGEEEGDKKSKKDKKKK